MATLVKQTIGEHDVVEFTEPVAKLEATDPWPAGTQGTVISDYGDHKMLDIDDDEGVTLDEPVVAVTKLKLIAKHSR